MAVKKDWERFGFSDYRQGEYKTGSFKNNPTPKSEHAADAIMMNITKVEPNREQPRKNSMRMHCLNWQNP